MALLKQTDEENGAESGKMLEGRCYVYSSLGREGSSLPWFTLGV